MQSMGRLALFSVCYFLPSRNVDIEARRMGKLSQGEIGEPLPVRRRISGPTQCLPILWTTGDATLTRFSAISWRTREFFSDPLRDFIAPSQRILHARCINENDLSAQAAMIVERSGNSTKEELIPGMGNMGALSWLNFGHARYEPSARIQVGVFLRLAICKIRIPPPFFLSSFRTQLPKRFPYPGN